MKPKNFGLLCCLLTVSVTGCSSVRSPQFYNLCQRDLTKESRLYEFHDPFPDESAGPNTVTRPNGFSVPRSNTRSDFDLRMLYSMSSSGNGMLASSKPFPANPLVSPIEPAVPLQPTNRGLSALPSGSVVPQ